MEEAPAPPPGGLGGKGLKRARGDAELVAPPPPPPTAEPAEPKAKKGRGRPPSKGGVKGQKGTDAEGQGAEGGKNFSCPHCGKIFTSMPGLQYHLKNKVCIRREHKKRPSNGDNEDSELPTTDGMLALCEAAEKTKGSEGGRSRKRQTAKAPKLAGAKANAALIGPSDLPAIASEEEYAASPSKKKAFKGVSRGSLSRNNRQYATPAELKAVQTHRVEMYAKTVHPTAVPRAEGIELLSAEDAGLFLPAAGRSTHIRTPDDAGFKQIGRFEATTFGGEVPGGCFNAGGPVHQIEWCPTPHTAPAAPDYVAVVAGPTPDMESTLYDTEPRNGLVQIWAVNTPRAATAPDFGPLTTAPSYAFGIAVDDGHIKRIAWCPSGAWVRAESQVALPRLGLLAVATGSTIQLYAVPHPASLEAMTTDGTTGHAAPVLEVVPLVQLQAGTAAITDMSWSTDAGRRWIGTTHVNGTVALFDMDEILTQVDSSRGATTSWESLRPKPLAPEAGPTHVIKAQEGVLRSLSWCPDDPELIAVVGHSDSMQVWDLASRKCVDDLYTMPDKDLWKTGILWPAGHTGVYLVVEECRLRYHMLDAARPTMNNVLIVAGAVLSVDHSPWLGMCATSGTCGNSLIIACPKNGQGYPDMATANRFSANVLLHRQFTEPGSADGSHFELITSDFPSITNMSKKKLKNLPEVERKKSAKDSLAAALSPAQVHTTTVRFSPNLASANWIASGTGSGLVVLQQLAPKIAAMKVGQLDSAVEPPKST